MPLPRPSSRTDHAEPAGTWTAYAPGVGPRPVNATVYGSPSTNTFTRAPATSPSGAWTTPLTVSVGAPSRARAASDSVARSVWTDAVVAAAGQGVSGRQGVLRAHGQHHIHQAGDHLHPGRIVGLPRGRDHRHRQVVASAHVPGPRAQAAVLLAEPDALRPRRGHLGAPRDQR